MVKDFFDGHPSAKKLAASVAAGFMLLSPVAPAAVALASPTTTEAPAPAGSVADLEKQAQAKAEQQRQENQKKQDEAQKAAAQKQKDKKDGKDQKSDEDKPATNTLNEKLDEKQITILKNGFDSFQKLSDEEKKFYAVDIEKTQGLCVSYAVNKNKFDESTAKALCNSEEGKALAFAYLSCRGDAGENSDPEYCASIAFSPVALEKIAGDIANPEHSGNAVLVFFKDVLSDTLEDMGKLLHPVDYFNEDPLGFLFDVGLILISFTPVGPAGWAAKALAIGGKAVAKGVAKAGAKSAAKTILKKTAIDSTSKEAEKAALQVAKGKGEDSIKGKVASWFGRDSKNDMIETYQKGYMTKTGEIADSTVNSAENAIRKAADEQGKALLEKDAIKKEQTKNLLGIDTADDRKFKKILSENRKYDDGIRKVEKRYSDLGDEINASQSVADCYKQVGKVARNSSRETYKQDREILKGLTTKADRSSAKEAAKGSVKLSDAFNDWTRKYDSMRPKAIAGRVASNVGGKNLALNTVSELINKGLGDDNDFDSINDSK